MAIEGLVQMEGMVRMLPKSLYLVTPPDRAFTTYVGRVFTDKFDALDARAQGEVVVELRLADNST